MIEGINVYCSVSREDKRNCTLDKPVRPSFDFGIIKMCIGAWGAMSLKAKTYKQTKKTQT